MSSNTITNSGITSPVQSSPPSQHANTTTAPLNVDPVSTVFPNEEEQHSLVVQKRKSKKKSSKYAVKKKSSLTSVKKTPKLKKGE
jgi:arylamine N-acetyltransferase